MKVYADNSAGSFPKAPGVSDAIKNFLDNVGCNIGRDRLYCSIDQGNCKRGERYGFQAD